MSIGATKERSALRRGKHRDFTIGRDNIFRDLELPNAEELDTKASLALEITRLIRKRKLTQIEAATILGIDQPKVSALVRGRLEKFSVERLCELLTRMGCDVDIHVRERKKSRIGRLRVSVG